MYWLFDYLFTVDNLYASSSEGEHPTQCICSSCCCAPSDEQAAQPNIEVISIIIVVIDFLIFLIFDNWRWIFCLYPCKVSLIVE